MKCILPIEPISEEKKSKSPIVPIADEEVPKHNSPRDYPDLTFNLSKKNQTHPPYFPRIKFLINSHKEDAERTDKSIKKKKESSKESPNYSTPANHPKFRFGSEKAIEQKEKEELLKKPRNKTAPVNRSKIKLRGIKTVEQEEPSGKLKNNSAPVNKSKVKINSKNKKKEENSVLEETRQVKPQVTSSCHDNQSKIKSEPTLKKKLSKDKTDLKLNKVDGKAKQEKKASAKQHQIVESADFSEKPVKKKEDELTKKAIAQLSSQLQFYPITTYINLQPTCIAIGDIEGNINKLYQIYQVIKSNPKLEFVFIGDLFDDLSNKSNFYVQNWQCLSLLSGFFPQNIKFTDKSKHDKDEICLPDAFKDIKFNIMNYDDVEGQVKFIAGNSECDALLDLQQKYRVKSNKGQKYYIFGDDDNKYQKILTFEQMCLVYRYFKCCHSRLSLQRKFPSQSNTFSDTIVFRHYLRWFRNSYPSTLIDQTFGSPDNASHTIYIMGHAKLFNSVYIKKYNKNTIFMIDDSYSQVSNNLRVGIVYFDNIFGFSVKVINLNAYFDFDVKVPQQIPFLKNKK